MAGIVRRGLSAVLTFGRNIDDLTTTAQNLLAENQARLARYTLYWRMYHGQHWDWERDKNEPFFTINLIRKFVDKHTGFLFKKGFKVVIPDDEATEANEQDDREFIRLMLETAWDRNKRDLWGIEAAQMGGVTGDLWVRVSWETEDPLEPPYPRADILPSRYVFPDFGGPHGVDRKRVNSILVIFPRYRDEDFDNGLNVARAKKLELYGERWFADHVEILESGKDPVIKPNPLGEIPIVHIPNHPVAGEYYGKSDVADADRLQKEFNEKATDVSDAVNYHGSPVTVVYGAKLSTLERGANRMWGLPVDAKVENLKLDGDLDTSLEFLKLIKEWLHEISGVPEAAIAPKQTSGESAVALAMHFMPMTDVRDVKVLTYGLGLRLINRLFMKYAFLMDPVFRAKFKKLPDSTKYRNNIKFGDPLPRDETRELEKSAKRLDMRISSRRREMEKDGLSQAEIKKVNKEIEEDMEMEAELEFSIGSKFQNTEDTQENRGGNPNPRRPDPEMQGEKKSESAAPENG